MIRIAIVDDEKECIDQLHVCLLEYEKKFNKQFFIDDFFNSEAFLAKFKSNYDIIFLEVDLPGENGFQTGEKIRRINQEVVIFFCTYLAQYAIKGYSISAKNYFVKPIKYFNLEMDFNQVIPWIEKKTLELSLIISEHGNIRKLFCSEILYIESKGHNLIYHLKNKENIECRGDSLSSLEKKLEKSNFVFCNSSYLVNLEFCSCIKGDDLFIGDDVLKITRTKRKYFIQRISEYFASNGIVIAKGI